MLVGTRLVGSSGYCAEDVANAGGYTRDQCSAAGIGAVSAGSVLAAFPKNGDSVQTGMVGCDGAVGAFEAFVGGQYFCKGVVQVPGEALRLSATSYRELFNASAVFRSAGERYIEMLLTEARQCVVCNALHPVGSRLIRSILDVLDRSCIDGALPLTQETLAQMLGAQRTTIAVAMSKLQRAGLIKSGRGAVEIRDKATLERLACNCRKTLQLARTEIHNLHAEPRRMQSV